jgi:hypothetical protein
LSLTIDLEAPALDLEENVSTVRQGILGRLNLDNWRSSSKIEALVEELSNLRLKDATTKSIVFSQFVNFLDLIAFRLQRAGFNVCFFLPWSYFHSPLTRSVDWKGQCRPKPEMPLSNISVRDFIRALQTQLIHIRSEQH